MFVTDMFKERSSVKLNQDTLESKERGGNKKVCMAAPAPPPSPPLLPELNMAAHLQKEICNQAKLDASLDC